ncbi:hypothetical protein CIP107532_01972 [Corynebacterium diphtheriae]|nr:hypothetical protein CIP107532_01972 [Corynebacterium diphtheriae]CAB0660519.1 hypothetical protein CIP107562_01794 [Corynebacterium diphtheriae]CAB0824248.1 hypothetical protein FRC0290_01768 [Corynebacterium diphtheriae]
MANNHPTTLKTIEEFQTAPPYTICAFTPPHGHELTEVAIKNWDGRWETTIPAAPGEDPWVGGDWADITMHKAFKEFHVLRWGLE